VIANELCKKAIRYRRTLRRVAYRTTVLFVITEKMDRHLIQITLQVQDSRAIRYEGSTHQSQAMNCYIRLPFHCQPHSSSAWYYFFLVSAIACLSRAHFVLVSVFPSRLLRSHCNRYLPKLDFSCYFVVLRVGLFLSLTIRYHCIQRPTPNWNTSPQTSER
jgi:hypothetical protein